MTLVHASCVDFDGRGVLIRGPSGAGKSDLALRLIDQGWNLVADDQTELRSSNLGLFATSPAKIAGWLETRGMGLMTLPYCIETRLVAVANCMPMANIERLPDHYWEELFGHKIASISIDPTMSSSCAKIRLLMTLLAGGDWPPAHDKLAP